MDYYTHDPGISGLRRDLDRGRSRFYCVEDSEGLASITASYSSGLGIRVERQDDGYRFIGLMDERGPLRRIADGLHSWYDALRDTEPAPAETPYTVTIGELEQTSEPDLDRPEPRHDIMDDFRFRAVERYTADEQLPDPGLDRLLR